MYSLRLSLYRFDASTFAGEEVFGSLRRLEGNTIQRQHFKHPAIILCKITEHHCGLVPLDTCQDSCHIVCGAPTVLENIETKLAGPVDIGVKHLANKLDAGWFVGVLFFEVHHQAEGTILKGSISGPDNDGIPVKSSADGTDKTDGQGSLSAHTRS